MPYLMGGFPTLEASRAIGEAYADGGADLVELGMPFSDPLADGPVIQAAGTRGAARRGDGRTACSSVCERLAPRLPVVRDVLREPRAGARAPRRSPTALRDARARAG